MPSSILALCAFLLCMLAAPVSGQARDAGTARRQEIDCRAGRAHAAARHVFGIHACQARALRRSSEDRCVRDAEQLLARLLPDGALEAGRCSGPGQAEITAMARESLAQSVSLLLPRPGSRCDARRLRAFGRADARALRAAARFLREGRTSRRERALRRARERLLAAFERTGRRPDCSKELAALRWPLAASLGERFAPSVPAPSAVRISAAVAAATARLAEEGAEPRALLLMDLLHRRFGVGAFSEAAAAYDALGEDHGWPDSLWVYRRLVAPHHVVEAATLGLLVAEVDRVTAPALYCDRLALPPGYAQDLASALEVGEYELTHAGLALGWLAENGCTVPAEAPSFAVVAAEMTLLIGAEVDVDDLQIEAATLLGWLGEGARVPDAFVAAVLDAQRADGGWAVLPEYEPSHWHTTALALWLLLELYEEPLGPSVPQPGAAG